VGHTVGYRRQPGSNPVLGSPPWSLTALLEVLDALTVAEVDDRIRQAAQTIYQALIEAELTQAIGAAPHQRTPSDWPSATAIVPAY